MVPLRPLLLALTVQAPSSLTTMLTSKRAPSGTSASTVLLTGVAWLKSERKPTVILPLFQNTLIGGLLLSFTCNWAITTFCARLTFSRVMFW
ncbi:hypothetical protein D3C73_1525930 [compost metagenome]